MMQTPQQPLLANAPPAPDMGTMAPMVDDMNAPPAYEDADDSEDAPPHEQFGAVPPPQFTPDEFEAKKAVQDVPPDMQDKQFTLTEEQARTALLEYIAQNCCYGTGPAKKYKITSIEPSSSFHYVLETFTESRDTAWCKEPYRGGRVDDSTYGPMPGVWDIVCHPQNRFADATVDIRVPHTEYVRQCRRCRGRCFVRCRRCNGRGNDRCNICHGTGKRSTQGGGGDNHHGHHGGHGHGGGGHGHGGGGGSEKCASCHGRGRKQCHPCHGRGREECSSCSGAGQLRWYLLLTVSFKNHCADRMVMRSDPKGPTPEMLSGVSGDVIYAQEQFYCNPIAHMGNSELNDASGALLQQHQDSFPMERRHGQRQRIETVPVFRATYSYKGRENTFWIYGHQHEVFAPFYESTFLGCCVIC